MGFVDSASHVKVAMGYFAIIAKVAILSIFSIFFYNSHDLPQKKIARIYRKKKLHD